MKELFPKHADDVTQSTAYRVHEILSNDPPMLQVADTVPELVDDVSWQEVDVIVSQRHTSILHPLPENNIS